MKGIIVAVSPAGVIGLGGKIPWHYKGDLRRFKRLTTGGAVVMGRRTWESIGKPLPGRRNLVVTRQSLGVEGLEAFRDIATAVAAAGTAELWFIGGARIYEEAMGLSDFLDVTYVPDVIDHPDAVRFPAIDAATWEAGPEIVHEDEPLLRRRVFTRRGESA